MYVPVPWENDYYAVSQGRLSADEAASPWQEQHVGYGVGVIAGQTQVWLFARNFVYVGSRMHDPVLGYLHKEWQGDPGLPPETLAILVGVRTRKGPPLRFDPTRVRYRGPKNLDLPPALIRGFESPCRVDPPNSTRQAIARPIRGEFPGHPFEVRDSACVELIFAVGGSPETEFDLVVDGLSTGDVLLPPVTVHFTARQMVNINEIVKRVTGSDRGYKPYP